MAEFYSARSCEIPPLPWTNLSPPFSDITSKAERTGLFCSIAAEKSKLRIERDPLAVLFGVILRKHVIGRDPIQLMRQPHQPGAKSSPTEQGDKGLVDGTARRHRIDDQKNEVLGPRPPSEYTNAPIGFLDWLL